MSKTRLRGIEMAYDTEGSGPAVVLLHGYPFNRSMWREQMEALQGNFRVLAPDLRGLGETEASAAEEPATMDEMARDVAALMDELKINRAVIGGLSMGGYVALAFARRFPLRVRALVLADTRPQADTDDARRAREEQARKVLKEGMSAISDGFLKKVLAPATLRERPEIVARVRRMIEGTKSEGAAAALRGMAARIDQTGFLPSILAPTLIFVGSEDQLTPPADAEIMRREIRGSRLEIIAGAAHVSNIERPSEFNRSLMEFLRALLP
ncbi:MAG TPA: alpha/beta fold hydrolase [Pyrinomonadaceae bacterium]|jgi:pimeloyl-ACP methyl ester carboxylesterase|nr:alpha/beta fold hydrolase [Pyrinomonadaceae bacterium]